MAKLCKWLECPNEALPNNPLCDKHLARVLSQAGGFGSTISQIGIGLGIGVVGNALYEIIKAAIEAGADLIHMITPEVIEHDRRLRSAAGLLRGNVTADNFASAVGELEGLSEYEQAQILRDLAKKLLRRPHA